MNLFKSFDLKKIVNNINKYLPEYKYEKSISDILGSSVINSYHYFSSLDYDNISSEQYSAIVYNQENIRSHNLSKRLEYGFDINSFDPEHFFEPEISSLKNHFKSKIQINQNGRILIYGTSTEFDNVSYSNELKRYIEIIQNYFENKFRIEFYENHKDKMIKNVEYKHKIEKIKKQFTFNINKKLNVKSSRIIEYFLAKMDNRDHNEHSDRKTIIPLLYEIEYGSFRKSYLKDFDIENLSISSIAKAILFTHHHLTSNSKKKEYFNEKLLLNLLEFYESKLID